MPASDVHIIATFEEAEYHNIYIQVNPSGDYGGVFLTEGYVVQNDQVKSYEGENVVFNVTPNLIDIDDESKGYHELYSVTVTYTEGGQTISYTYTDGNYNFTMPDADVTITATFIYDNGNPLYLLGSANGGDFLPYGPRFNYDTTNQEYYIDVYFKGTNEYGGNPEDAFGYFCLSWGKWTTWDEVNQQTRRAQPYDNNYLISSENPEYMLCYDNNKQNAFKIPAGIYRIYVKSYGYHDDKLTIVKYPTTLTLDPAGGATAAEAVEAGKGQVVTLAGDIYDKIMALNPDEPAANFKYQAAKTIGENTTTDSPVSSTTTATATLDVVNEGTTVTQLDGANYLGWIVANTTGYYKVIDTPPHWIEEFGEKGSTYTVSDRLQGVYAIGSSLWCKDLGDISIVKTEPADGQIDLLWTDNYTRRKNSETWDQSNWVELDFGNSSNGVAYAEAGVNKYIKAGTVTGTYTDDVNYKLAVTDELQLDGDASYVPNTYCTVNFLESNLTLNDGDTGPQSAADGKHYYLLNPKVQEYAVVTYAMWDQSQQIFVVPKQHGVENSHNFNGAFSIGDWSYNIRPGEGDNGVLIGLNDSDNAANVYEFHMIVKRTDKTYGTPPAHAASRGGQTASPNISVWPIDLEVDPNHVITAVTDVRQAAQVAGVTYVNVAGMSSTRPWSGVNIVVTRYTDGTTTTAKVVK